MQIHEIMDRHFETISPEENLFDAAQKMKHTDAGVLPVTTPEGHVVGILTDRDIIVRAIAEGRAPFDVRVDEVMTADPVTCRPDCPLEAAVDTMHHRNICRLVVTEDHNKHVCGIANLADLLARAHEMELLKACAEGVCH